MNNYVSFLFSLVILFPAITGIVRYRSIRENYRPFVWLILVAALTELLSRLSIKLFHSNAVVSNIYCLAECMLILYQFYRWRFNAKRRNWYWAIPALLAMIWITENLFFMRIGQFGPVFRVSYAFVIVMLSINEINYLITHENRGLLKNARFIICIGFIIFFLYQMLFEGSLYISAVQKNAVISNKIISIAIYINVLTNIIFGVAMLLIPKNMLEFNLAMERLEKKERERTML